MTREEEIVDAWVTGYLFGQSQSTLNCLDEEAQKLIIRNAIYATKTRPSDTAELIALNLEMADQVASEIYCAKEDLKVAGILYQDARFKAMERKVKAQECCAHWATRSYADANSSDVRCLICGAEVEA